MDRCFRTAPEGLESFRSRRILEFPLCHVKKLISEDCINKMLYSGLPVLLHLDMGVQYVTLDKRIPNFLQ